MRFLTSLVLTLGIAMPVAVSAADQSLPYRNFPGFQCHNWNSIGECVDFSYDDYGRAPSAAGTLVPRGSVPSSFGSNLCVSCARGVSVRVRATNSVIRGGHVNYSVYIRNDDTIAHSIPVRVYLDPQTTYVSGSLGGRTDGTMIRWDDVRIGARSSITLAIRVSVNPSASVNSQIVMTAQAAWSSDSAITKVDDLPYTGNTLRVIGDNVIVRTVRRPGIYQNAQYIIPNYQRSYTESTLSSVRYRSGNGLPYSLYMQQGGLYYNNGYYNGTYLQYSCEAYGC